MSARDKWVRRFSVDETARHKNGFTIYKITSVLFPLASPEAATAVSVWRRYSDAQRLHRALRARHASLGLAGALPALARYSYFKRFQPEVIAERAKAIKSLLEFIAEHKLLFTSTEFVNFLQTGYPEPESSRGVINTIRTSLHLPIEDAPPLEYQTSDDDSRSPAHTARQPTTTQPTEEISHIPIYESSDIELPSKQSHKSDSFESINSLDSISDDLYSELDKVTIDKRRPCIKVLPDLINFDVPSTSFEDYSTRDSENVSIASTMDSSYSSVSKSVLSLSNAECKTKTEDSYVFEAGYMLNLAARYEDLKEYQRAFDCYKAGIEKMLIGVQWCWYTPKGHCDLKGLLWPRTEFSLPRLVLQESGRKTDSDPARRALIKQKTNTYLAHAEALYNAHMCGQQRHLLSESASPSRPHHCAPPARMLSRPYAELAQYRVLAVLGHSTMLVLHRAEQACYAMKVIRKIPNNLTEFDEYFLQTTNETREPILPTVIPYMVPLHSYIQTNNLIFLILSYAPGEKLFDYIKNYAKSIPNTPARELNLENVFSEPKTKQIDLDNNLDDVIEIKLDTRLEIDEIDSRTSNEPTTILERIEANIENNNRSNDINTDNIDLSVNELVKNSQTLLMNVDKVLTEIPKRNDIGKVEIREIGDLNQDISGDGVETVERREETPNLNRSCVCPDPDTGVGCVLPPSAVARWGAQILTALESLHNLGVICRDLNPSNILLGARGQVILTYFIYYPGLDMSLSTLHASRPALYTAPELYASVYLDTERDASLDKVCDFWSFGAIMYELICGVPLCEYHRSPFTSHTTLQLPDGVPTEVQSLLTQLLTYEPSARLGAGGVDQIKRHPYFKHVDWTQVYDDWTVPT